MAVTFTKLADGQVQIDFDSQIGQIVDPGMSVGYNNARNKVYIYDKGVVNAGTAPQIELLPEQVPAAASSEAKVVAEYLAANFFFDVIGGGGSQGLESVLATDPDITTSHTVDVAAGTLQYKTVTNGDITVTEEFQPITSRPAWFMRINDTSVASPPRLAAFALTDLSLEAGTDSFGTISSAMTAFDGAGNSAQVRADVSGNVFVGSTSSPAVDSGFLGMRYKAGDTYAANGSGWAAEDNYIPHIGYIKSNLSSTSGQGTTISGTDVDLGGSFDADISIESADLPSTGRSFSVLMDNTSGEAGMATFLGQTSGMSADDFLGAALFAGLDGTYTISDGQIEPTGASAYFHAYSGDGAGDQDFEAVITNSSGTNVARINGSENGITFFKRDNVDSSLSSQMAIGDDSVTFLFGSSGTTRGARYSADYSAAWDSLGAAALRVIPDIGWVSTQLAGKNVDTNVSDPGAGNDSWQIGWDETNNRYTLYDQLVNLKEKDFDPPNPPEGHYTIWMSDGTASGDDGDVLIKITAGGVTKTTTLVDFSAI